MYCRTLLCVVLLWHTATTVHDFKDQSAYPPFQDCEFIYHDTNRLLLTMYKGGCYFGRNQYLGSAVLDNPAARAGYETALCAVVSTGGLARQSTLDKMRDEFQDLLADFHCAGKDIYMIDLPSSESAYHTASF